LTGGVDEHPIRNTIRRVNRVNNAVRFIAIFLLKFF
jgi:hypothetical protein